MGLRLPPSALALTREHDRKYDAGGLGLNAAHFAQLSVLQFDSVSCRRPISTTYSCTHVFGADRIPVLPISVCLFFVLSTSRFSLYHTRNIGSVPDTYLCPTTLTAIPASSPPRGRFSHLAMFRLGSLLFIPAYASVTLYHAVAGPKEDGNFILMTRAFQKETLALAKLLTSRFALPSVSNQHVNTPILFWCLQRADFLHDILSAVRYCGATFSYTAVAILLNYSESFSWSKYLPLLIENISVTAARRRPSQRAGAEYCESCTVCRTSARWLREYYAVLVMPLNDTSY